MAATREGDDTLQGRRRVLEEYRQHGKRFIPPFLQLPNLKESRWLDDRLPESIWIALLIHVLGIHAGTDAAMTIARAAAESSPSPKRTFAGVSDYASLTSEEMRNVTIVLTEENILVEAQRALSALIDHYDEFPLSFLGASRKTHPTRKGSDLSDLKETIAQSRDRHGRLAVLVQTTTIGIAIVNDVLKMAPGVGPASLEPILDYPSTEESRKVAAFVRSASLAMLAQNEPTPWTYAFWQAGRTLEECEA